MEVSVVGRQASLVKPDGVSNRDLVGFCESRRLFSGTSRIGSDPAMGRWGKRVSRVGLKITRSEMVVQEKDSCPRKKSTGPVRLFVGLPLDSVSHSNTINQAKAISAGLRALKLLGADGVELPIWWGVAEKESMGRFDWTGYLTLAHLVRDAGLHLRVSLHLHASKSPSFPLPQWLNRIAEAEPDILFTDRSGRRHGDCLSLAVDDLPVLDGRTPMQVFEEFFLSFRSSFSDLIGSTITDISVGLGPDGELRYPSFSPTGNHQFTGVGEFQCYGKYMLDRLNQHAKATGNVLWGLSGPHDVPSYNQSPDSGNFFKENGGSWETPYGQFFLSWYSNQLLSHGDRLLSVASSVFGDCPVTLSGKVPLLHPWHKTRSRPLELTSGFYNTEGRYGYDAFAEMFARNSCMMILPGMNLSDQDQPQALSSSPESLLSQIMRACNKHGVRVSGENSSVVGVGGGYSKIKENLSSKISMVDSFTFQRMGAQFFSPENWPLFMEFVRNLNQPGLDSDDLLSSEEEIVSLKMDSVPGNDRQMQAV